MPSQGRAMQQYALSSGTAAMHLALKELGVGPGDEVIGSTLTFVGSISPVIFLGASVVLVDCDRTSWNMDPDLLARDPFPHYEHTELGFNYRMSNVLAGIGRGQLTVLDDRVQRRREIFDYYRGALKDVPGIEFMPEAGYGTANRWLTVTP